MDDSNPEISNAHLVCGEISCGAGTIGGGDGSNSDFSGTVSGSEATAPVFARCSLYSSAFRTEISIKDAVSIDSIPCEVQKAEPADNSAGGCNPKPPSLAGVGPRAFSFGLLDDNPLKISTSVGNTGEDFRYSRLPPHSSGLSPSRHARPTGSLDYCSSQSSTRSNDTTGQF